LRPFWGEQRRFVKYRGEDGTDRNWTKKRKKKKKPIFPVLATPGGGSRSLGKIMKPGGGGKGETRRQWSNFKMVPYLVNNKNPF